MQAPLEPGAGQAQEGGPGQAVCGRNFSGDTRYFPRSTYRGQTLIFCTEFCQRAFLADPQRFLRVHRQADAGSRDCEFLIEKDS